MIARSRPAALSIALLLSVSACASSDSEEPAAVSATTAATTATGTSTTAPTDVTVDVRDMAFSPATVTIAAGQTVTWNFDDGGIPHAVFPTTFDELVRLTAATAAEVA